MNRRYAIVALALVTVVLLAGPVMAQEAGAEHAAAGGNWAQFLGAAFAIAFSMTGGPGAGPPVLYSM